MQTLSRALTAQFFTDPDHYTALRRHWSALMRSNRRHKLSPAHHLLYLALCGRDWRKAFTPIRSQIKLSNGAFHSWGLFRALHALHLPHLNDWLLEPFDGIVTPAMLDIVRPLLPQLSPYRLDPDDIAATGLQCDASLIQEPTND